MTRQTVRLTTAPADSAVQMGVDIFGNYNIPSQEKREIDDSDAKIIDVPLPIEFEWKEGNGGDIFVGEVPADSESAKLGIKKGMKLVKVSATFGDEMWSARGVGMTQLKIAIQSRFGGSISLGFEKQGKKTGKFYGNTDGGLDDEKAKRMAKMFDDGESELENKNLWNPFR